MRVAVVGLGYVGLVTAACLARLGQEVDGLESDPAKIETLRAGRVPYFEPNMSAELETQRASGRLRITDDPEAALRDADIVMICVGTPSDATGRADLGYIEQVVDSIGAHVQGTPIV